MDFNTTKIVIWGMILSFSKRDSSVAISNGKHPSKFDNFMLNYDAL